jgi:hypothetical protein
VGTSFRKVGRFERVRLTMQCTRQIWRYLGVEKVSERFPIVFSVTVKESPKRANGHVRVPPAVEDRHEDGGIVL